MSDLKRLRDQLLELDRPDRIIRLADKYLQQMREMGDEFVLPREHVLVKPILEFYAGDDSGWLKFVKNVRDRLPRGDDRRAVQEFYRLLDVRVTQQSRRDMLNAAVDTAVRLQVIPGDVPSKQHYARRCTQEWLRRKREFVGKGLTKEERSELLEAFWEEVDQEIVDGKVPKP